MSLVALAACAKPFESGEDGFQRGGASPARAQGDGGSAGSSGGSTPPSRDGGVRPPVGPDAGSQPPCDPSKGVGEVIDVAGLASASATRAQARLSSDELHVVFAQILDPSVTPVRWDLYTASRASVSEPFAGIEPVTSAATAFTGSLSADGLSLYFTPFPASDSTGLQLATRAAGGAFTGASILTGGPKYAYDPFASIDGRLLFTVYPDRAPSMIQAAALSGGALGPAQTLLVLPELDIGNAALSSDGAELFYAVFPLTQGPPKYRRATRQPDGSYAGVAALAGLDESNQEPTWVSADACRVYMTDWRGGLLRVGMRLR